MDARVQPAHDELCELLRLTRKEEMTPRVRQTNPTGKSAKTCPALPRKIFRLTRRANQ
jgi:hypothetical protein